MPEPSKNRPQSVPGPEDRPISGRKQERVTPKGFERSLLLNRLLVLARVAIDLVERQETAADPACLDVAEIAALVLRDYGDRTLRELKFEGAVLDSEGIELWFQTRPQGKVVKWSLLLTRHKPGSSDPSP